ncbi:hypothetical protein ABPG75_004697 [Micractinium tetrahymenae]
MGLAPAKLLALLCASALLLFSDRGVVSCNSVNGKRSEDGQPGYGIQGEFDLSLSADGLLAAALMTGLMLSAPACSQLSRHFPALRLMGLGLSLWVLGAAGCALAPAFAALLACRLLVGAAVGPFIALAAPLIDDQAPPQEKSLWLAALFLCIPVGFATGYIYGGLVGTAYGWRAAFGLEATAMLPLAALMLLAPPVELRHGRPPAAGGGKSAAALLAADCRMLARTPVAMLTILALSVYNGALGCYAFYGPKAARDIFSLPAEKADLLFGGVTVLTGVLGTVSGGVALDAMGPSVRNALLLCIGGVSVGCVMIMAGFAAAKSIALFAPAFAIGELGMFLMAAPVNAVLLWSVPPGLRPFALAAAEFSQHALGDIPSPPALGWLQGRLGDWRVSMCATTGLLAVSVVLFTAALCRAKGAVSYREVAEVEGGQLAEEEEEEGSAGSCAGSGGGGEERVTGSGSGGSSPEQRVLRQPLLAEQA